MIGLIHVAKKDTAVVNEVTNIAPDALRNVYAKRNGNLSLMMLIFPVYTQKSWKTKISSQPIPMIMTKTEEWIVEK